MEKRASHVQFNQTVCALRFFYGQVLQRPEVVERIHYARAERHLPVVLSVNETIRYRDYADGNADKFLTLTVDEFLRRFLLHVLPPRFVRIRCYGFLANRIRTHSIDLARRLIGGRFVAPAPLLSTDAHRCPQCRAGTLRVVEIIPAERPPPSHGDPW